MATSELSFVDKVYDTYIKSDYKYGQSDLNPVREIKTVTKADAQDELNALLAKINSRVNEISSRYSNSDLRLDENGNVTSNKNTESNSHSRPSSLSDAIDRAGGSDGNILHLPGEDVDPDVLTMEVEKLIAKILITYPDLEPSSDNNGNGSSGDVSTPEMYSPDCNGVENLVTGEVIEDDDDSTDAIDAEGGDDDDDDDSSSADEITDSSGDTAASQLDDASDAALEEAEAAIKADEASAKQCALGDLGILKALLAILKVVKKLKQIIAYVLPIAIEIIEIVTLAAQAWVNPPSVSEILAKIQQKIMAMLVMIVAQILVMLWQMLGLDCLSSQVKNVLDEVKASMAAIDSIFGEVKATAVMFDSGVDKVLDAYDEAKKAVEEAYDYTVNGGLEDYLTQAGLDAKEFAKDLTNKDNLKAAAIAIGKEGVDQSGVLDEIMDTVENIQDTYAQAKDAYTKYMALLSKQNVQAARQKGVETLTKKFNRLVAK